MRSMTPRVLRHLLLVGGLALAGWLLCGAGQAHAAAGHGNGHGLDQGAGTAAIGSLPHAGAPAKTLAGGRTGRLAAVVGRPRNLVGGDVARSGVARRVIHAAARPGAFVHRAGGLDPVVTLPTGRVGIGASWVPRHHTGAVADHSAAAVRHDRPHNQAVRPGVVRPAASVAVNHGGRSGHAHARTVPATHAPPAGFPRGAAGETGALPSPGSASAGGLAGHAAWPATAPQPSIALRSVLGAVPPAVHTATDEPAVSPD